MKSTRFWKKKELGNSSRSYMKRKTHFFGILSCSLTGLSFFWQNFSFFPEIFNLFRFLWNRHIFTDIHLLYCRPRHALLDFLFGERFVACLQQRVQECSVLIKIFSLFSFFSTKITKFFQKSVQNFHFFQKKSKAF